MKTKHLLPLFLALFVCAVNIHAQEVSYQRPPQEIEELVLAEYSPGVSISETNNWMIELQRNPFLTVKEMAQPELRLAGGRFDPNSYSSSKQRGYRSAIFVKVKGGNRIPVTGLPQGADIASFSWYPDADKILLFIKENDGGIYVYTASVDQPEMRKLSNRKTNSILGYRLGWVNDTDFIIHTVPRNQGNPPVASPVPSGPMVQENAGKKAATRTYQDLLKNKHDEDLFDYYFTSQPVLISANGEKEIGQPAIYTRMSISPDRKYLLTGTIQKPYSYILPMYYFPSVTKITDMDGNEVKTLTETPFYIPLIGYDTTSPYPRGFNWRSDKPATIYWTEALDEGNPRKNKVEFMDAIYQLPAPFTGDKEELLKTRMRSYGISWSNDNFALYSEGSSATRRVKTYIFKPGKKEEHKLLFDLSTDDRYNNPGNPYMVKNEFNRYVIYTKNNNNEMLMMSEGASPEGNMPYLSSYNIAKKENKILWRCQAPYYERIVRLIDPGKLTMFTSRQSVEEPANYFLRDVKKKRAEQLTSFPNPYPSLTGMKKEKIRYKRADGLDLTATVYLPAGYDKEKDGKLPVLMWAYPIEYRSASDASQVRGSKYTFTGIGYGSPVFWVTRGYCVMDNVEMPIVGEKGVEPNDTFVEQLVMNAEAAVKVISDMGVGDPDRVAVGGHSYGAFMTANLLTHTKLFKAGIARSGAYNRTLTPFGFQAERRTYWEAPEVYNIMSPFMHADKINGAVLLIHGEIDNNSGTFPIQSERYYDALKGHGATVRYVVLPLESHGYAAKENILHMLYETDAWLEKHVKNSK